MGYRSITQIVLVVVAFILIFTYIKPTLESVKTVQDELFQYSDAVAKAAEFNALLRTLLTREQNFSSSDVKALEKFMPTDIDEIGVMRDIETIVARHDLEMPTLSSAEVMQPQQGVILDGAVVDVSQSVIHQDFNLELIGKYESFKEMLVNIEQNAYLLEIVSLQFGAVTEATKNSKIKTPVSGAVSEDEMAFSMTLRVYALQAPNQKTP